MFCTKDVPSTGYHLYLLWGFVSVVSHHHQQQSQDPSSIPLFPVPCSRSQLCSPFPGCQGRGSMAAPCPAALGWEEHPWHLILFSLLVAGSRFGAGLRTVFGLELPDKGCSITSLQQGFKALETPDSLELQLRVQIQIHTCACNHARMHV